jgi:uncharacterized protein (TIGR01319 family)
MFANRSGSILAADLGSVHTRVVLFDLVDGSYRLIARTEGRTTSGFPFSDVNVGLMRTVKEISEVTDRVLLNADQRIITPEQADLSGVEFFVATASTGRPLRTVMVGLVPEISIASGLRAAAGTYVEIVGTLSLDDTRSEEDQVNMLVKANPDLVLITGGTEYGAIEPILQLARLVQLALLLLDRARRPVILYAGNSAIVPQIRTMFDGMTALFIAPNVRPSLEEEYLEGAQLQLGQAFDAYKATRGGGFDTVGQMSERGVLPTAQSYDLIVEYLGRAQMESGRGVLAVDVGSAVSTLSAYLNSDVNTTIRTDIGLGHSAHNLLESATFDTVQRWLPFPIAADEIDTYTRNKALHPESIPETLREMYIEHALLRSGIQLLVEASRPLWYKTAQVALNAPLPSFSPVIGAGSGLTRTGSPGFTALLMLDSLQPEGITNLQIDPHGLIPVLGALASVKPEAVVQVLDNTSLESLGTSFSLSGQPRVGRTALRVKIKTENGEVVEQQVDGGSLWIYPLDSSTNAEVEVRVLRRGTSIGGKSRIKLKLEGGTAGLIFDARGRPLPLAKDPHGRATQLPLWVSQATGDPLKELDERWFAPPSKQEAEPKPEKKADKKADKKPAPKPEKKSRFGRRGKQEKAEKEADDDQEVNELDDLRNVLS